jgi:Arc/MetJ-type ribon-helix-helix transcriptional regulator
MGRKKTGNRYDTIKIPEGLTAKIDLLVKESKGDFTSRTDVIKFAVRLLYMGKEKKRE